MATKGCAVYRLFGPNRELLYVGRSASPESRIALHRRCIHGWQSAIADSSIEWFPSATAARKAARLATVRERPENVDPTLDLAADPVVPVYLYRLFDMAGDLLYIGVTKDVVSRFEAHRYRVPWERCTVEEFPDRATALDAEATAIAAEQPRMNVLRGRNGGPAEERRPARRLLYDVRTELREGVESGTVGAREAIYVLTEYPGVTDWKAADMLGLDVGGKQGWRKYRTADQILELNGLA